jgi:diguanylate cyclase (GGDEF)-like protein
VRPILGPTLRSAQRVPVQPPPEAVRITETAEPQPAPHVSTKTPPAAAVAEHVPAPAVSSGELDLDAILGSVQETVYRWDLKSDRIAWAPNALATLLVREAPLIATAQAFHLLIAPEHAARRVDAIRDSGGGAAAKDTPAGRSYRVQYRFMPRGRRDPTSLWLEDHGTWTPGPDGKPASASGVVRVINERYQEEQRLLFLSDHDALTGQLNRVRLNEALDTVVSRSQASGQPAAFLIAAISNLASINETFGFQVGDEVIAEVGRRLKSRLRSGDTIGRYSSNKFGLILNDCGPGAVRIAAERLLNSVRNETIKTQACELPAAIAIGGVQIPNQANSEQQAIAYALEALDKARARRFGCFMGYEPSLKRESERRRNVAVADQIIAAINDNRMHLALQPIVHAGSGEPALFECLLRLEQPDGSIVSAGEFIAVAEKLGLGRMVDKRAMELAVGLLKEDPRVTLGLNVSSLSTTDHEWLVALHALTAGRRDLLQRLAIEITETAAIEDLDQTRSFVDALKELGCSVAIDDFGAGYTSFRNLKYLDVDMVKIDGSFIKNLTRDRTDKVFVETLVTLARTFRIETVAEWVGDAETAEIVRAIGVDYMQGFHFGQPMLVSGPGALEDDSTL